MGAFFLYHESAEIDRTALLECFRTRGFAAPLEFPFGPYRLLSTGKLHLDLVNHVTLKDKDGQDVHVFAWGSFIYDGLGHPGGMRRFLQDHLDGGPRAHRLAGAFCAVVFDPSRPRQPIVYSDSSGIYQLYMDDTGEVLSNSQLFILAARKHTWEVNPASCLELLVSGYQVAPATLFHGLNRVSMQSLPVRNDRFRFQGLPTSPPENEGPGKGFSAHVDFQLEAIRDYFGVCKGVLDQFGADLGLSGGFDSRLLILVAKESVASLSTHTHVREKDHADRLISREIARRLSVELHEFQTRKPEQMETPELESVMDACFRFYDGNCVTLMDYMKHEYTPAYRRMALGANGINLSGVGGEIYRNYNNTPTFGRMDSRNWVAYYVLNYQRLGCITTPGHRDALVERHTRRLLLALRMENRKSIDFTAAREYYGKVWLSSWHGVRNSVEGQLGFYLSPFSDHRLVGKASLSIPHLGRHGAFEAAMICRLDPEIAAVVSSYGYPFSRIPLSSRYQALLRTLLPNSLKLALGKSRKPLSRFEPEQFPLMKHAHIRDALARVRSLGLPIDWQRYLAGGSERNLAIGLGFLLDKLSDSLRFPAQRNVDDQLGGD